MARKTQWILVFAACSLLPLCARAQSGEAALKKELAALNLITGNDPMRGALKGLVDDKKHAQELLQYGLPAAKKKGLSYNAALVLALAASDLKDMKMAEVYFKVCMEKAAKLQSHEKLKQSYGLLIELYYDYKMYADSARICRELLELNTDDGTERKVIGTMVDRFGEVEFKEPQDGFDTAQRLRPQVQEMHVKAVAKQGKFDQALHMVEVMLKKEDDWNDLYLKGWVLREANKLDDAAGVLEDVIKRVAKDDRYPKALRDGYIEGIRQEVSGVYVDLKKIDRATVHLEILIKRNPENPRYYNDLGYIWADHDMKLEEAEKLIRKALDLDKERRKKKKGFDPKTDHDSGAYLDSLGWVLFKQKKNEEAKDALLKAVEDKSAQHLEIYDHLGDVYLALGERDAAIKSWQKGLEFSTDTRHDVERKAFVEKKLEKAKGAKEAASSLGYPMDQPIRIVLAKVGLDGHDRGIKVVARALRDAGLHVIYAGLWQTPEAVVRAVADEDADWLGLSLLSGAHMTLVPRVLDMMKQAKLDHVGVLVGGIIPEADIPKLHAIGVAKIFGPGTSLDDIVDFVKQPREPKP